MSTPRAGREGHVLMVTLTINGEQHELDVPDEMPLLWVIRDVVGLTGTKFGCGAKLCGCCTTHIDGQAMRTCVLPASYEPSSLRSRRRITPSTRSFSKPGVAIRRSATRPSTAA